MAGKLRHGLGRLASISGQPGPSPHFPGSPAWRGRCWGPEATPPGSREQPRAASPSARASSGCSPPRTPARQWLTAPCGAAGERARSRAGPGRGRSCGAAAAARDARAGGVPVTLGRARTRTRTRAHPLALPHAADVPFLNLRNVFLGASEGAGGRARGGGVAGAWRRARGPAGRRARLAPCRSSPPLAAGPRPLCQPRPRRPRAATPSHTAAGLIWCGAVYALWSCVSRLAAWASGRTRSLTPRCESPSLLDDSGEPE